MLYFRDWGEKADRVKAAAFTLMWAVPAGCGLIQVGSRGCCCWIHMVVTVVAAAALLAAVATPCGDGGDGAAAVGGVSFVAVLDVAVAMLECSHLVALNFLPWTSLCSRL